MPSTLSILTARSPPHERGEGDRHLGRRLRPRHRDRPGRRRLADRARRLELDLPRQPAVRRRRAARRPLARARSRATRPRRGSTCRGFALSIAGLTALVWAHHRGAVARLDRPARSSPRSPSPPSLLAAFVAWELRTPRADARRPRCSATRASRAASAAITLAFFALFGTIFFLTQYLQVGARLLARSRPACASLPVAAGLVLGGPLSAQAHRAARHEGRRRRRAGARSPAALLLMTRLRGRLGLRPRSPLALRACSASAWAWRWRPPPTSIMGSLPLAKASVGSAVNDTTRTTGGALGVAVLGSLLASGYRGDMDAAVAACPAARPTPRTTRSRGALAVAARGGRRAGSPRPRRRRSSTACTRAVARRRRDRARRRARRARVPARARERERERRARVPRGGGRMSEPPEPPAARPGRPRSAAADQAIVRATLELLVEDGYRGAARWSGCARAPASARRRSTAATAPRRSSCATAIRHLNQRDRRVRTPARCGGRSSRSPRRCSPAPQRVGVRELRAAAAGRGGRRPGDARALLREPRRSRGGRSMRERPAQRRSSAASCAPTSTSSWRSTCSPGRGSTGS